MRKTIEVEKVRTWVNTHNERSGANNVAARDANNGLLGTILQDTGNYAGFRYLDGFGPWVDPAEQKVRNPNYDDSRRFYHRKVQS